MGVANVIPGVSGGTIALITGIYEKLINSLKSFDTTAFKLIIMFDIKAFIRHTNLYFLIAVFGGSRMCAKGKSSSGRSSAQS